MQRENQPHAARMERIETGEKRTPTDVDTTKDASPAGGKGPP